MWRIFYDALNGKETNIRSPEFVPSDFQRAPKMMFMLLDGDDNIYFIGFMTMELFHRDPFAPKDDYGDAFGCTSLQYLEEMKWKEL